MQYQIRYHPDVKTTDIPKLNKNIRDRIRRAIERKLLTQPGQYSEPLRKTLTSYRKLRVGDYRIVLRIDDEMITIYAICHRKNVYQRMQRRVD
jgi:mRNA interferase RelE/StbE